MNVQSERQSTKSDPPHPRPVEIDQSQRGWQIKQVAIASNPPALAEPVLRADLHRNWFSPLPHYRIQDWTDMVRRDLDSAPY